MNNIYVLTQNVKIESLRRIKGLSKSNETNVFLTTNFLFENERKYISNLFDNVVFRTFADYLKDDEMQRIDIESYKKGMNQSEYIDLIRRNKNELVKNKVFMEFPSYRGYILSKNLGVDNTVWEDSGFKYVKCEYYSPERLSIKERIKQILFKNKKIRNFVRSLKNNKNRQIKISENDLKIGWYEGKKYIFLGRLNRIDYRLDLELSESKEDVDNINNGIFEEKEKCTYVVTWHEHFEYTLPDNDSISVRWAQDGYLPPNYSHYDYEFKPDNVVYYCWDKLGTYLFKNKNLPYEIIPFRKKLYIPSPVFPSKIQNVLIVASGSGDWTALKNRSDDDIMVDAFAQMAKKFKDIQFTYRCHPTWVHPNNVGVNAINRVNEYFESLSLPNLKLSSNTPLANENKRFMLSFSRSSLDEDLKNADFVFGEHSISMVDAAFKGVPFCSVNLTNRRNFFVGMNDLGFPSCRSHYEIEEMLKNATKESFKDKYIKAVDNYNKMTDIDIN